ncbi:hypothetical protein KFF05_04260 [bacterium SCSIO 12827]|nr:hypothetical protein KFF05_04260 [bacterium SCSIO 12827]
MAGLDPAIHAFLGPFVDARNKSGHDDLSPQPSLCLTASVVQKKKAPDFSGAFFYSV